MLTYIYDTITLDVWEYFEFILLSSYIESMNLSWLLRVRSWKMIYAAYFVIF